MKLKLLSAVVGLFLMLTIPSSGQYPYAAIVYNTNTYQCVLKVYFMHTNNAYYGTNITIKGTNILNELVTRLKNDGSTPLSAPWNVGGQSISNVVLGAGSIWAGNSISSTYLPFDLGYGTNYPIYAGTTNVTITQTSTGTLISVSGGSSGVSTNTNTLAQVLIAGNVASTNIGMGVHYINQAGDEGKGIFFDVTGKTYFPKDIVAFTNIVHYNDLDTMFTLADNEIKIIAGGTTLGVYSNAGAQPAIKLGVQTGDLDIELNKYKVFVQGSDGYVGINTNLPGYQLDVNGNTRIFGTLNMSNNIVLGTNNWLTGDGGSEGIKILGNGTVYIPEPIWCNSNIWMGAYLWVDRTYPGASSTNWVQWDTVNKQVVFNFGGTTWSNKPSTGVFTNYVGNLIYTNQGVKLAAGTGITFNVVGGTTYVVQASVSTNLYSWGGMDAVPTNATYNISWTPALKKTTAVVGVQTKTGGGTCVFDVVTQFWTNGVTSYSTNYTGVVATVIATNIPLNFILTSNFTFGVVSTNVSSARNWWYSLEYLQ